MDNNIDWVNVLQFPTSRSRTDGHDRDRRERRSRSKEIGTQADKWHLAVATMSGQRRVRSPSRSPKRGSSSAHKKRKGRSRSPVRYRSSRSPGQRHSRGSRKSHRSRSPVRRSLSTNSSCSDDHIRSERLSITNSAGSSEGKARDKMLLSQLVQAVQLVGRESINKKSLSQQNILHQNILPEFDPSHREQTITMWLNKVNECQVLYNLTEQQTIQIMLPKLKGLAQKWHESLPTILLSWQEWQEKLKIAFSSEENSENYGQLLATMLEKRVGVDGSFEEYFHEKVMLLNRCGIEGKRAVDCIVFGIEDRRVRLGAEAASFDTPDLLLRYLKNFKIASINVASEMTALKCERCSAYGHAIDKCTVVSDNSDVHIKGNTPHTENVAGNARKRRKCHNCRLFGHQWMTCPNPLINCTRCSCIGHTSENCVIKEQHIKLKCFNCSATTHDMSKCPKPLVKCEHCFYFGHTIRNCIRKTVKPDNVSGREPNKKIINSEQSKKCFNCNENGHYLADCPKPTIMKCDRCCLNGHTSENCQTNPEDISDGDPNMRCHNCRKVGHKYTRCPEPLIQCDRCSYVGHTIESCKRVLANKPENVSGGEQHNSKIRCLICQQEGHKAAQCPDLKTKSERFGNEVYMKCSNCQQKGHIMANCPAPLIKCDRCSGVGHSIDNCSRRISTANPKTNKQALVNGKPMDYFMDFDSVETMISVSAAKKNSLYWQPNGNQNKLPMLKGFGDVTVRPVGSLTCKMEIDCGRAEIQIYVVPDAFMPHSLIVGQSFTEQSHVFV